MIDKKELKAALDRRISRCDNGALGPIDNGFVAELCSDVGPGLTREQAIDAIFLIGMHREEILEYLTTDIDNTITVHDISHTEAAMLRPMAETLAMISGNAFFNMKPTMDSRGALREHWEYYLPNAKNIFLSNGGMYGWAGETSFAKPYKNMLPWLNKNDE